MFDKEHLNVKKLIKIISHVLIIVVMIIGFLIVNIKIYRESKLRFVLVEGGQQYCYGVDLFEREGDLIRLKGWFFELKSIQKVVQSVSKEDAEWVIALIPLNEAIVGTEIKNATVMDIEKMHEERPDVNEYFSCEYDYSKCGFSATVDCDDIDLRGNSYRIAITLDADLSFDSVLTDLYITDKGLLYTDPRQTPELDTDGTDLEKIVKDGVRLVSRPDCNCYVYQLGDKLYWIADTDYAFNYDGLTYIQYQMNTTQIDKLPTNRLEDGWLWSNIGGYFEQYEITDKMNCGKYRVMMRDIPRDYSITDIETGYHDGEGWIWLDKFRLDINMLK